jgi:bisphosphoglycerate-dependent phosphoglycerate mutase
MNSNLIENSFYTRYLKYKMKYINLKNTIGGTSNEKKNIMIVSHNTRIRCIIESLDKGAVEKIESYGDDLNKYVEKPIEKPIENSIVEYIAKSMSKKQTPIQPEPIIPTTPIARLLYNSTDGEIRFKNCAILLIELKKNSTDATIELIDEGTINSENRKKGWYFGKTNEDNDVKFPTFTFPISLLGLQINDIKYNYNIYIMRHGEATHNTYKNSINVFWDTDLTENGINQAKNVADSFKINFPVITFDLLCASKLRRSRNTLNNFIKNYNPNNINDKIYVIPCNHELAYHKENCDKNNNGIGRFYAPENRSNCDIDKDGKYITAYLNPNRSKDYLCEKVDNHVVDWTLHQKYYEDNNRKCEDSNFIKILVQNYDNLKENKNNYTF